ncbi:MULTISPECIES: ABC transporter permease [Thioclava]|uniref:ABC transporter permease n=1 Tax=Thioclava nitratireducens TaxID=1915078 RepID=A0ABM6IFT8_9RHOB|nr:MULTISPECIES: ABC transporter permease subunit [Thioclava]AQS47556.1 ABC transporter permease [Thioclava nitratireducens]OWY04206.1 ABC transporter permease [Thioclava sp. IC9]OWY05716.1 ABC transporter permease [Thioclava sp. F1Mire-8]OWY11012.1 ABC transporter permease [Thioclava sp. F42-5]OWY13918.1 ABC transporter permease [Thioclava sp. F34-6]
MLNSCSDPSALHGLSWLLCYLTTGKHMMFYGSFGIVLILLAVTAPVALIFGFGGALAARSTLAPLKLLGRGYIAMVRGVPDIIFFLFVPIAMDQGLEYLKSRAICPDPGPAWTGNEFHVCAAAKIPLGTSPQFYHEAYGFALAVVAFSIVYGAFAANVLFGAMQAVPRAQLETAEAYGMTRAQVNRRVLIPQMWAYAIPGLSNLWMILIKATPLLFLLGIEDIVYWARELGATKSQIYSYPHPDWRLYYFLALLVFYLVMTKLSEIVLARINRRLSFGQATAAGEALRKAGA